MRGPERLYYDKSCFTGVHKHGGPSTVDHVVVALDRAPSDIRGVNLPCEAKPTNAKERFEQKVELMQYQAKAGRASWALTSQTGEFSKPIPSLAATERNLQSIHNSPSAGPRASRPPPQTKRALPRPEESSIRQSIRSRKQPRGPERLFYDKNCFTGVHKNAYANSAEGGLVDLQKLVDRSASEPSVPRGYMTAEQKLQLMRANSGKASWSLAGSASASTLASLPSLAASERSLRRGQSDSRLPRAHSTSAETAGRLPAIARGGPRTTQPAARAKHNDEAPAQAA
mmetsp:Transcript_22565/g.46131  ORF Transcript_22565/g.46131 Transcript_22565/m.46131 type:complete len:285 (+) Transcript_22565:79-933(+)